MLFGRGLMGDFREKARTEAIAMLPEFIQHLELETTEEALLMLVGVTGATGKIGRWLVKELLDRGYRVRAMARATREGHWGNTSAAVDELREWGAEIFFSEFTDYPSLHGFCAGTDVLIHNGYHHVDEELYPAEWTELNILSSVKLYEAMWKSGGRQIIFISSGAVYGSGPSYERQRFPDSKLPIDERTMTAPRGMYAAYKSCIEHATVAFKTVHGMAASTSIRPMGDGVGELLGFRRYDDKGLFAPEIRELLSGKPVTLKLAPRMVCVDGRDIGIGCDLLIRKGLSEKVPIGDWYLVGNTPITPGQFIETLQEVFGPLPVKLEIAEQPFVCSDDEVMRLGYLPRGSEATLRRHFQELAGRLKVTRASGH
jgi:nucleoside-diphosphate-sugar epimerase